MSWIEISPAGVTLAALKRAEDGNGYIVRVFNEGDRQADATIDFYRDFRKATLVNLVEAPVKDVNVSVSGRTIRFKMRTNQVVSLRIVV